MFIFARHGETEWNDRDITQGHTDIPLNSTGREQAVAMREALRERHGEIDAYYSSDLQRAAETAHIIADGAPVTEDNRLREQCFGDVEGQNMAVYVEKNPEYNIESLLDYHRTWPNGESTIDAYTRVSSALDELRATHDAEETVLVVAHTTPLMCLHDYLRQGTLREARHPENGTMIEVPFDGTTFSDPTYREVGQNPSKTRANICDKMHTCQFEGKADTFMVFCTTCEAPLEKNRVTDDFFSGWRVTCSDCEGSALVYDDRGIYKMVGRGDTSLDIRVQ